MGKDEKAQRGKKGERKRKAQKNTKIFKGRERMKRTLPKKLKKILKQDTRPPMSKRFCLLCEKMRDFKYNRMTGHSECSYCGSSFAREEK